MFTFLLQNIRGTERKTSRNLVKKNGIQHHVDLVKIRR